jgi:hypothetical protein
MFGRMDKHIPGLGQGSEGCKNNYFVPNGELGEQSEGHNEFFENDMWAYHLAASLQHLDTHQDGLHVEMNMANHSHGEEVMGNQSNENISVSSKGKKVAHPKNLARRGGGFTKAEDKVICSAFLNVSKDPITGVLLKCGIVYNIY